MKKPARKSLTWVGVVLIVIVGSLVIVSGTAGRSVGNAYAALEAEGRPMTFAEVEPAPIPWSPPSTPSASWSASS